MKWRAEHRVCELRSTSAAQVLGCDHNAPQTLAHYYQRRLLGVDAAGRVTLYQNYRTMLAKDLKRHIPLDTVLRFHVWEQERCSRLRIIYDAFLGAEATTAPRFPRSFNLGSTH